MPVSSTATAIASLAVAPTISLSTPFNSNAGVYLHAIAASGAVDPNYNITYVAGTLTILRANLTVTVSNVSETYDGKAYAGGGGVTYSGFRRRTGRERAFRRSGLWRRRSGRGGRGGYVISASGLSSNNYAIRYVNGALTIDPALLQVIGATVLNKSYDGTNSASVINASLAGVIAGDNVALSPANATFASVNVGQGMAVVTDYTLLGDRGAQLCAGSACGPERQHRSARAHDLGAA